MLLCIHVANFALAVARQPHVGGMCILADKADRGRVLEVDEAAHALGARTGQTVLQACAAAGGARVLVHDAVRSHALWEDMLDALDALSPLVDDAAEGTAYAEMRGCGGTPGDWIARARQTLAPFDLPVRVAAGPNKFVARAATYVRDGCICAPDEAAHLMAPLPLEVLALETRVLERLHLLGIRTLGELARLPHGPFVRRFGSQAARWHEYARGIDAAPFRPRPYTLQIEAAVFGEGSAVQEEQVYFALRVLAERVCSDLNRAGKAVALLKTTFECENGDLRELDAGFAQPTADPRTILDILRAKLEGQTFDAPITGLRLQAMRLEECGVFATLFARNEPDPQALAVALERLLAAGDVQAHQARVRPAHLLESRYTYCHPEVSKDREASPSGPERCEASSKGTSVISAPQLRMLAVREVAVKVRGNVPASVDARAVMNCAGPWRVDDGWHETHVVRDEYDVLLEDGALCRIYRQGEQWYLQGAYD
ncbi:MAG TPA: DNA polymerase Y family protein [Candidatus Rubrimentiphilum sp.]|nr:DNA polymerase Y family protein [Candidatus Rubrimentiphilum sp.]